MKIKMNMLKLKISTKSRGADRWHHEEIDKTPALDYEFNRGTNWKASDYRLSDRTAVARFRNTYWEHQTIDPKQNKYHYFGPKKSRRSENIHRYTTNLSLYEDELELEIQAAIAKVEKRWQAKYKADFENQFEDDLVKFVNSK